MASYDLNPMENLLYGILGAVLVMLAARLSSLSWWWFVAQVRQIQVEIVHRSTQGMIERLWAEREAYFRCHDTTCPASGTGGHRCHDTACTMHGGAIQAAHIARPSAN